MSKRSWKLGNVKSLALAEGDRSRGGFGRSQEDGVCRCALQRAGTDHVGDADARENGGGEPGADESGAEDDPVRGRADRLRTGAGA